MWNAVDGYVLTDPVIQTAQGRKGRTDKVYLFFFITLQPRVEGHTSL